MFASRKLGLALLATAALCAACSSSSSPPMNGATYLKLANDQSGMSQSQVGSVNTSYSPLTMTLTKTGGYACFALGTNPLVWPSGSAAEIQSDGTAEIIDIHGNVVAQNGKAYDVVERTSPGYTTPCNPTDLPVISIEGVYPE